MGAPAIRQNMRKNFKNSITNYIKEMEEKKLYEEVDYVNKDTRAIITQKLNEDRFMQMWEAE